MTCLTSYYLRKHELVVVSGHQSGEVRLFDAHERPQDGGGGEPGPLIPQLQPQPRVVIGAEALANTTALLVRPILAPDASSGSNNSNVSSGSNSSSRGRGREHSGGNSKSKGGLRPTETVLLPPRISGPIRQLLPFRWVLGLRLRTPGAGRVAGIVH